MLKSIPELVQDISPRLRTLSAAEGLQESRQAPGALIIDVREPEEVSQQPVVGSTNIPRGVLEMKLSSQHPDPKTPIYIHCATGARAILAAEQLERIGYRRVTALTCPLETLCQVAGATA